MSRTDRADASRWYHSLYWRIMVGFILVVAGVIVAQGLIFSYAVWRGQFPADFPPPGPPPGGVPGRPGILEDLRRVLSLPTTGLLVVASGLAAWLIFGPARRRLRLLTEATARIGEGDLDARAPEHGGDEIARLARAFNRMADEIAARDHEIRLSDRLRRQMFADVSHELKTPLTAMRGYLETLRMKDVPLDEATRERYLETVERETLRLDRLVRDLLDLARYENLAARLDIRPFSIDRLLAAVVQRHEHEAQGLGIGLHATVGPGAEDMVGDPHRLDQAVENLVANALHHTPRGGSVSLSAAAAGDTIELAVVDSGEGIPGEHLPHVFDRFYKVDASRTGAARGSGLGLTIVKAIVEQHGGQVRASSRPGETRFTITLPRETPSIG